MTGTVTLLMMAAAAAPSAHAQDLRGVHTRMGQCIVESRAAAAAEYVLDVETDEAEARKMHEELPLVSCWEKMAGASGGQLRLPGDTLRYALADALVRKELSGSPMTDFSAVPPLPRAKLNEEHFQPRRGTRASARMLKELAEARSNTTVAIFMAAFGECVARAAPLDSHKLLMTNVNSAEESARFEALSGAFERCRPAELGQSVSDLIVRGAVALSYYRLARAAEAEKPRQ